VLARVRRGLAEERRELDNSAPICSRKNLLATISEPTVVTAISGEQGALIQIEDVHKYYDLGETRVHALRGVTLQIGRGEFAAIMGASGS